MSRVNVLRSNNQTRNFSKLYIHSVNNLFGKAIITFILNVISLRDDRTKRDFQLIDIYYNLHDNPIRGCLRFIWRIIVCLRENNPAIYTKFNQLVVTTLFHP